MGALLRWTLLCGVLMLGACASGPPKPCWYSDKSCGGEPGRVYVVGKVAMREGYTEEEMRSFAMTMAMADYSESVIVRIKALDYVNRSCRRSKDRETCEEKAHSILKISTRSYVRKKDLTLEDVFSDGKFVYVWASVPDERFVEHVRNAGSSLPIE